MLAKTGDGCIAQLDNIGDVLSSGNLIGVAISYGSVDRLTRRGEKRDQTRCDGWDTVFVALHFADLEIRVAGEDELCTVQDFCVVFAVDLADDGRQRPGVDRAFGGFAGAFAVGIVAVFQAALCLCCVFAQPGRSRPSRSEQRRS